MRQNNGNNHQQQRTANNGAKSKGDHHTQQRGRNHVADQQQRTTNNRRQNDRLRDREVLEEMQELTMISLNIRGFNAAEKQQAIYDLITESEVHLVCLNETKLQYPLYLDNFWSQQSMLQRNGGCWTAATKKVKLSLVKALGTYLCWTRLSTGSSDIQVLNCYLEPGEQPHLKERAKRVTDIIKDIIKQDANAALIVCGDFNNHMPHMLRELHFLNFSSAIDQRTITHRLGGHLDQIFTRGVEITNALVNDGFDSAVTDHKCIKVSLKLK